MKGKGEICTYWLVGHVDGPKPRLKKYDNIKVDSPFINKDKSRLHITFLDDEAVPAHSGGRKGSLIAGLHRKPTGRSPLANSFLRLKSTYSNSCSTVALS